MTAVAPRMVRVTRDGPVAHLTLDRPEAANALDREGVAELRGALDALGDDVELIAVRGAGGRCFCGGADSREMVSLPPAERQAAIVAFTECCIALWEHPALTVAVVEGYATGGGAHVALACDLRVLAPEAWLQFPSSSYGLHITVTWLTLHAGPAAATTLSASRRRVGAEEAQRLGLAQAVAPGDEALEALGIARAPHLRELKAAVRQAMPPHVGEALRRERDRAVENVALDRFVESLSREPSARRRS